MVESRWLAQALPEAAGGACRRHTPTWLREGHVAAPRFRHSRQSSVGNASKATATVFMAQIDLMEEKPSQAGNSHKVCRDQGRMELALARCHCTYVLRSVYRSDRKQQRWDVIDDSQASHYYGLLWASHGHGGPVI